MKYQFSNGYRSFKTDLSQLKRKAVSILSNNKEVSVREFRTLIAQWRQEVLGCININIQPEPNFLETLLDHHGPSRYESYLHTMSGILDNKKDEKIRAFKDIVRTQLKSVKTIEDYLLLLNKLQKEDHKNIESIQQKLDYIMQMLYLVFNDNHYRISTILDINFVSYRKNEPEELAVNLLKKGYVSTLGYGKDNVKLTVKGAAYVERKKKADTKKKVQNKEQEINKKIDVVLEKLESLGYGQEIIFEEIEELKSLSTKLNKKNWLQLLKGKVIDLAVSQVINKETASYILDTLSEGTSKLLIEK